jgi:hypothetical protein
MFPDKNTGAAAAAAGNPGKPAVTKTPAAKPATQEYQAASARKPASIKNAVASDEYMEMDNDDEGLF